MPAWSPSLRSSAPGTTTTSISRAIDSTDPEDLQDINAHLRGGIPVRDLDALAGYWKVIPGVRAALFSEVVASG